MLLFAGLIVSLQLLCLGNELCFSLETASDYVKDEKACLFGFRCTVVGYKWPSSAHQVRYTGRRSVGQCVPAGN